MLPPRTDSAPLRPWMEKRYLHNSETEVACLPAVSPQGGGRSFKDTRCGRGAWIAEGQVVGIALSRVVAMVTSTTAAGCRVVYGTVECKTKNHL